ncbi:MAG TPA: response regulator, partial [Candidatus Xenobia bacterium]
KEGEGSTFHFTGTFGVPDHEQPRTARKSVKQLTALPVLVVDDNATNLRILEQMLLAWDMKPTLVSSGTDALKALERYHYELVITDHNMPQMDGFTLSSKISENAALGRPAIIMLTSSQLAGDTERSREAGVFAFMTKPVNQSDLFNSILASLGLSPAGQAAQAASPTFYSPTDRLRKMQARVSLDRMKQLKILMAEDNPINQTLASTILEGWNHDLTVVDDGLAAVEAVRVERFDLILMDMQMPRMDGFEATAQIRQEEKEKDRPYIPIIALTAHALKGDKERCLAGGMDGYVSKPLQEEELFDEIVRLSPDVSILELRNVEQAQKTEPSAASPQSFAPPTMVLQTTAAADPVLDMDTLYSRIGNKKGLLKKISAQFLELYPQQMADIEAAVRGSDMDGLHKAAHKFKGSLGNFAAEAAVKAAFNLEMIGRDQRSAEAQTAYRELVVQIERLKPVLEGFQNDDSVPAKT